MSDVTVVLDHAAIQRLLTSPSGDVGKALTRRCIEIERRAKGLAPVDTGRLRSSITHRLAADGRGLAGIVGTNVEYAAYVEFGTRHQAARSFLRAAIS